MSKENPIDWYSCKTKSSDTPSVSPPAEGAYAKHNKTLDRDKYLKSFRVETEHFMISVPESITWDRIIAVNKHTLVVEYTDCLVFPAGEQHSYYQALHFAACMRFVDWIKKKEANPFFNAKLNECPVLTDEQLIEIESGLKREPVKGYDN